MNKFLLLSLLFTSFLSAQTTNYNTASEEVTKGDLLATNYELDSLANAVYIFEKGFTEIDDDEDYDLVTQYVSKIKILNKDGIDAANIEIPLGKSESGKKVSIKDLEAHTYKLIDDKLVKRSLDPSKIYTKDNKYYDLKSFALPDVEAGDVIYVSYKLISPFKFNFKTWYFQEDIPKMHTEFTSKIPGNYEYNKALYGDLKLDTFEEKLIENCISFNLNASMAGCVESFYVMNNVPAFKEEKYMTSRSNYESRLEFELKQITRLDGYEEKYTITWEDTDKEIKNSSNFGKQWRRDGLVEDILPESIKAMPNSLEKAKEIYHYVQQNYRWNEEYNIHSDMNLKDLMKEKTGNILEMNSLLHNLYASEEFEVYPVLASTRSNGFPKKVHPVLSDFNYFFIQLKIDNEEYLLDASDKNLDFGRLPYRALNSYARLMDFDNGSSWIDIQPKKFSKHIIRDSIKIAANGTATGTSTQVLSGYHALKYRKEIPSVEKEDIFNDLAKPQSYTQTKNIEFENLNDLEEDLVVNYELNNKSQKIDDVIYYNPFNFKFVEENPFNLEKRNYPIDIGFKDAYTYSSVIQIPEGYSVAELPEQKAVRLPGKGGSLLFSANKISENTVSIQCRLTFPLAIYAPEYYEGLKKFYNEILAVQNQSVLVLKENS